MRTPALLALPMLLWSGACAPPAEAPAAAANTVDTAAVFAGLDSLRSRYIALQIAGDAAGLAALHADSAGVDLLGVPRLRGRPAIEAALAADMAARKYTLVEITPTTRSARTNTDATERGTYHDMHDVKGAIDHEWGRWVGAFGKGTDGQWRILYLMAFPDSTRTGK